MSNKSFPGLFVDGGTHQFQQLFQISAREALLNSVVCHSQTSRVTLETLFLKDSPYKYVLSETEPS